MDEAAVKPVRFEDGKTMLVAGLSEPCGPNMNGPALWKKFVPYIGHIPGQIGSIEYGVVCNGDDSGNMVYMAAMEVSDFARLPEELSRFRIPEQRYAVFVHAGHISTIRQTWQAIFSKWLPESGFKATGGPEFERYTSAFDPKSGNGGVEIWVPIKM
jgi:AraC family transcriptional regulator